GHNAPFDPADWNVNGEVSDCIPGEPSSDLRDKGAADKVDQNAEKEAHEQTQNSEANRFRKQKPRSWLKPPQPDETPSAVSEQFDDEIKRTIEGAHRVCTPKVCYLPEPFEFPCEMDNTRAKAWPV